MTRLRLDELSDTKLLLKDGSIKITKNMRIALNNVISAQNEFLICVEALQCTTGVADIDNSQDFREMELSDLFEDGDFPSADRPPEFSLQLQNLQTSLQRANAPVVASVASSVQAAATDSGEITAFNAE